MWALFQNHWMSQNVVVWISLGVGEAGYTLADSQRALFEQSWRCQELILHKGVIGENRNHSILKSCRVGVTQGILGCVRPPILACKDLCIFPSHTDCFFQAMFFKDCFWCCQQLSRDSIKDRPLEFWQVVMYGFMQGICVLWNVRCSPLFFYVCIRVISCHMQLL